jgi:hypothetical protein
VVLAIVRTMLVSCSSVSAASDFFAASRKRSNWGFSPGFGGSLRGMPRVNHSSYVRESPSASTARGWPVSAYGRYLTALIIALAAGGLCVIVGELSHSEFARAVVLVA